jgi:CRISPR-associated endonuclease Csn1
MKDGHKYDVACSLAGYKFSASSLSKEEIEQRVLKNELQPIKKNSLRNPVVEKILNQLVNVINAILSDEKMGKPDEIRIELARELKANNEQRNKI